MALITGLVLLLFDGLGIASSPIVVGHPVLLSPERLALKTYLDNAMGWQQRFTEIDQQLALIDLPSAFSSATAPTAHVIQDRSPLQHPEGAHVDQVAVDFETSVVIGRLLAQRRIRRTRRGRRRHNRDQ